MGYQNKLLLFHTHQIIIFHTYPTCSFTPSIDRYDAVDDYCILYMALNLE